jgi:hypothetical protein
VVTVAGPEVVGPTGVAVAEPPVVEGAPLVTVPLPAGVEAPPVGAVIKVLGVTPVESGIIGVPEEQGTVIVVPSVTIVVYDVTGADVLELTEDALLVAVEVVAV